MIYLILFFNPFEIILYKAVNHIGCHTDHKKQNQVGDIHH